ncbi:MAG TPA: Asp-tRNA(Asn)/Glu-tRNA(Gln) amidotransferase GatCAB subunit A [Gammaproteobacteria bacterium]|nr:Asp-tRNA(Asn)/Glu-tRNA(Gln) amidotransferase GatCAB subunit A [Gammaproteobacteria bacterium]
MNAVEPLHYLSIDQAGNLIRAGELSPVDLTDSYLERIDRLNPVLHSYITVNGESARERAKAMEREIAGGNYRGPLHGIPVALKDLVDTKGLTTTYGSKLFQDRIPDRDATLVDRLKAAGCITLGKLTMSELAMVGPPGLGKEALNPWNTSYAPGGSSSGSATAVAAGLCAGSIGSDTGGSIRFPAANNNIVGLMPTYGRISRSGVMPLSWSLDHLGPMTRTVEDAALMLHSVSGFDPADRTTSTEPVSDFRRKLTTEIRGLRIGILEDSLEDLHRDTERAVEQSIKVFESLGVRLFPIRIPNYHVLHIANSIIYLVEAFNNFGGYLREDPSRLGRIFRLYGYMGGLFSANEYVQAMRLRSRTRAEVGQIFERVDLILSPTTNTPPQRVNEFDPFILTQPTRSASAETFNLAACPALSLPCGFSSDLLPIGLQLAAKPMDEQTLLNAAYAYQEVTELHRQHPPL